MLDMGEYENTAFRTGTQQGSPVPCIPAPNSPCRSPVPTSLDHSTSLDKGTLACPASLDNNTTTSVRLIQIVAPALLGRARVFGNQLQFKEDWACVDMPYFDAPGAPSQQNLEGSTAVSCMPAVTACKCCCGLQCLQVVEVICAAVNLPCVCSFQVNTCD